MPIWNKESLPQMFQEMHNTKVGTWAKLTILSGSLKYFALDEAGNVLDTAIFDVENQAPFVEPQQWHRVAPLSDDLQCYLEFYCRPQDYVAKKISPNEYIFSGRLEIDYIQEQFDINLPASDEYLTIAGLILHHYQGFPKVNEEVIIDGYICKIIKSSANKIELVKLKVNI